MSQRSDYGRCVEAYTTLTCQTIQMLGICLFVLEAELGSALHVTGEML